MSPAPRRRPRTRRRAFASRVRRVAGPALPRNGDARVASAWQGCAASRSACAAGMRGVAVGMRGLAVGMRGLAVGMRGVAAGMRGVAVARRSARRDIVPDSP